MSIQSTDFTAIDLGVSLGLNYLTSKYATLDDSFRLSLYKDANGDAPAYADLRFLGGTMAALYLHFNEGGLSPLAVNACRDISVGLLSSFVATETCRAAAVKRMLDSKIEQEAYGSPNIHIEEDSEDNWVDDPNLEDIYGMETSLEEEQVSYAYGW